MARPETRYYPRHTNDLRLVVKTLGFKATGTNISGSIIYYTNEEKNPFKKIMLPISNHINKNMASEVFASLKRDFYYTDQEILDARKEVVLESGKN